jgi:hypothetical protein
MRTTLDIEDDVLQAAKEIAQKDGSTAGKVISQLARKGLIYPSSTKRTVVKYRNGIPLFPSRGEIITLEHVQNLIEEEDV